MDGEVGARAIGGWTGGGFTKLVKKVFGNVNVFLKVYPV